MTVAGALEAAGGQAASVSGISDTTGQSLTWARRKQVQFTSGNVGYVSLEVWWTFVPSAFTTKTFTANWSTNTTNNHIDNVALSVYCVTGFIGTAYQTAPFDTALTGGFVATGSGSTASTPSVTGIFTNSSAGMLIAAAGSYPVAAGNAGDAQSFGSWTSINSASETGGVNFAYIVSDRQIYSTMQSGSGTVTWLNSVAGWIAYVDALTSGVSAPPSRTLMGVGQ